MTNLKQSSNSISALAIRQHIGTLMLTLAAVVVGFFCLTRLPVDLLPSITYPRIAVRLEAVGVSPEVAVDEITRPVEEAMATTDGVEQVVSQTREGRVRVDLYFQPGGDIDQALNDATAAFNRVRSRLPDTLPAPRIHKYEPSQLPVYEFALTSSELQDVDLRVFADEELARELTVVPGVASVEVSGGVREEVQVNMDLNRLQVLGVGLTDVLEELRDRNQDVSSGRIQGGETEPLTRTQGRFQTAEELKNVAFQVGETPLPQQVYLREFAEVVDGTEDQRVLVSLNGQPAVKVSIRKQAEANTVAVVDGVKARLAQLQESRIFPDDLTLTVTSDESQFIRNSIQNVTLAGLTGAILAAISVLLFLGSLRQTLIIVLAIPLASLTAIILMALFGLSLNIFSLGGLALGVGIVVDSSIVMLENIVNRFEAVRHTSNGNGKEGRRQFLLRQAETSSQELESALLASTTTNLVAVIPFLMIGGFISLIFNELILTISFAIAASLIVAITVVPMLTSRLLLVQTSSNIRDVWLLRQFRHRLQAATLSYDRFLSQILRRRILVILTAVLVLGGGSLWMVGQIPQEILPRINTGQAQLFAQFPPGTPLADNRKVMSAIDQKLLAQPETEAVFSTSGGYAFGSNTSVNVLRGTSTINLKPGSNVGAFADRMGQEFNQFNLVNTRLRISPESVRGLILNNSPVWSEIDLPLQGSDADKLNQAGFQILAALDEQATLARYRPDADQPQPEVQIQPDWERANQFGLTTQEIGETLQTVLEGAVPTQLQRGNRLVDIRVQLTDNSIQTPAQLRQIPLFTDNNQQIRLGDVANIVVGEAPGEIQRINQRQVFLIAGSLAEGADLSDALAEMDNIVKGLDLPEGVSVLPSFSAKSNEAIQSSLKGLGLLASFMVFVVMAVQYNSIIDPLVIMLTVPLALAGGIFGLYITQTAIGATVIVGAVLLVGIVVNNAIIMVELANQIRVKEQVDPQTAILKAAPQRLRPILMTTVTTVLGMFPLALGIGEGSEFLQPLGVVVFSGLSVATVLTLVIIPCFYSLLHDPRWTGGGKRKKQSRFVVSPEKEGKSPTLR
ncbi:efflux RND transporter permease subunit [Spirulina sp. CS-785/01]|uniref:efflux RND transporter permease subunit n=1 Tax=Spirulina sp. CS-785/01 TaxID=3021716 RepID=UPI00232BB713|nr:efflux RND transporter permease subunit [Spirulina sp. CS-785/01]MDB9314957.1 efflux RND transporter permease subunit [Spirulina sp. CS-785/01]